MKKNIFAVGFLFALAGCDIAGIRGNGHLISEQRNVDPFINIETGGAFRVEWHSGAPSASITVDENLMQYVEMEVRDKVLHVRTTRSVRPTHSIKLELTSTALEGASFSGASRLNALQLSGPKFYLETRGASNVVLDGAVDELVANMTGASDLRAESLQTKTAELSVTRNYRCRFNSKAREVGIIASSSRAKVEGSRCGSLKATSSDLFSSGARRGERRYNVKEFSRL
ncbi:MAG: hypothetical protein DMF19_12690 [Verrucomicrobia bacterium]|nr:MAG: hypothetical protein DMF19_12690 [Verrucomicrobiota bacterium]